MRKTTLITGAVFALLAVVLGAMGAHMLKKSLSTDLLNSFETGVRYLMYHGLALLVIGSNVKIYSKLVALLFILGSLLFSVSIFLLSTRFILEMESLSALGPITPIGGLLMISGWIVLIFKLFKRNF